MHPSRKQAAGDLVMSIVQSLKNLRHHPEIASPHFPQGAHLTYPVAILGSGSYLPPSIVSAEEFDVAVGKPIGWSAKMSGVRNRHVAHNETVIDMAAAAATQAIA